ncbi:winged helix-turn-helix transcriptional regulator [Microbaculum marinisediminis]|uniref:Helix-turn-helix transcriptional regulator n=1 Tax=Microbaculum marinisediminis TaxID=2931392 RepID=A0AAW5QTZ6_9HYPH|nr:helix-turn-helix domain-containing protein [Microbaculum sp. A6E488]MCT8970480.1 helix-turn-helix transcriptional regulator [Microbaculum sp. A6E488]
MAEGSYNQFCPVAMAAEILCTRWTMVLLRELVAGSSRFNELRRGVPRMSPALLSKRLKDLEDAGIVERRPVRGGEAISEYALTPAGRDLQPVIEAVGVWGQKWVETNASLEKLDPSLLMWDMRRNIDPSPMPDSRSTIQVIFSDQPEARRNWWLIVQQGADVDLCSVDPGFDVDLYLATDLRTMTEIWMGYVGADAAKADGRLMVTGSRRLERDLKTWFGLSPFAKVDKLVA